MASYDEYKKKYSKEGSDDLNAELNESTKQESTRPKDPNTGQFVSNEDATPKTTNWEDRYKELEKLNSRQAQDLGNYRKMVDEYISVDPTPAKDAESVEDRPITADDLYDNPEEAVRRAVDSHPDIRAARRMKENMENELRSKELSEFQTRHPDFKDLAVTPEFQNWALDNQTRLSLAQQADRGDLTAADALFSLYKAEQGMTQVRAKQKQADDINQASLESPHGSEPPAPVTYSRSEMLEHKIRAKQGDPKAERYVNAHAAAYREALGSGNVRD